MTSSADEKWSPKSTLLQVLVSIQSMILIDAPYFNECAIIFLILSFNFTFRCHIRPGYGKANLKAPASIAYNRNISLQTTRWAIVDWLRDEHRDGIWQVCDFSRPQILYSQDQDVIVSHFTIYKDKIRQK